MLKGYQADIDIANQFTGMLYEERGRGFLAPRGTLGYLSEDVRGTVGALESSDALKAYIKDRTGTNSMSSPGAARSSTS